jgi:hypothetical protein
MNESKQDRERMDDDRPRAWILARNFSQEWYFDHGQGD